jgi:hypothetical protein
MAGVKNKYKLESLWFNLPKKQLRKIVLVI